MDILSYLEDFDNPELEGSDWEDQMIEAVENFNAEYGADFAPLQAIERYKRWKFNKIYQEPV